MRPRYLFAFSGALVLLLLLGGMYVRDPDNSIFLRVLFVAQPKADNANAQRLVVLPSSGPGTTSLSKPADDHADVTPVVVASVTQADVPIFLSGIGTVVAYFTVDAKALVDGVILKVHFQEGDDVKIGDPLATIDPTPYAARVAQWKAAKERAQAQLENAKTNLWRDQQLLAHNFANSKTDRRRRHVGQPIYSGYC